jgi:hypothetical protein
MGWNPRRASIAQINRQIIPSLTKEYQTDPAHFLPAMQKIKLCFNSKNLSGLNRAIAEE